MSKKRKEKKDQPSHIGRMIAEFLVDRDMQQSDFCNLTGDVPGHLNQVISGKIQQPGPAWCRTYAAAMGISMESLVGHPVEVQRLSEESLDRFLTSAFAGDVDDPGKAQLRQIQSPLGPPITEAEWYAAWQLVKAQRQRPPDKEG